MNTGARWQPEWNALIGTAPDKMLGKAFGVNEGTVRYHRKIAGVGAYVSPRDEGQPLEDRFWARVFKGVDGNGAGSKGCWLWLAGLTAHGYGAFWTGDKTIAAHRFSLELASGPLGEKHALHTCDNPPCVRPEHLYAGAHADNMGDIVRRGRHSKGGWREQLMGRKFGSLTVFAEAPERDGTSPQWLARCECGKEFVRTSHKLKTHLCCCALRRSRGVSVEPFFHWCAGGMS